MRQDAAHCGLGDVDQAGCGAHATGQHDRVKYFNVAKAHGTELITNHASGTRILVSYEFSLWPLRKNEWGKNDDNFYTDFALSNSQGMDPD